jgi:hypothetical protein
VSLYAKPQMLSDESILSKLCSWYFLHWVAARQEAKKVFFGFSRETDLVAIGY